MAFTQAEWNAKWKDATKWWDIKDCPNGWDLLATDELEFEGDFSSGSAIVKIKRIRNKASSVWATGCTTDTDGNKIFGTSSTAVQFVITRTPPPLLGGQAALECVAVVMPLTKAKGKKGNGFISTFFKWIWIIVMKLFSPPTGGQPGSWTAEDGGNRPILGTIPETVHFTRVRRA
jgi:hypothetical protein